MASNKLVIFMQMIRFEHTIFALPFAYVGALMVERGIPAAGDLIWITLAMVGARTAAMSLNRLIDRHIDARNPRTASRALPQGQLSVGEVYLYVVISFGLLLLASYQLSSLAFKLFPVAVAVLVLYSYTKRFTWACHLVLGLALGLAPLGSWIAIAGEFHLVPILIALGVMLWVAGFDIIYACDDYDFDRREGIYSIPARFGIPGALKLSSLFHLLAPVFFVAAGWVLQMGIFYMAGVVLAVVILIYQHTLVSPDDLSKAGIAFFNLNGTLSMVMFLFTLLDVLVPLRLF
ncbi:MAG: UbiA-like polyprenyltransferase [Bacillota bacterium]